MRTAKLLAAALQFAAAVVLVAPTFGVLPALALAAGGLAWLAL